MALTQRLDLRQSQTLVMTPQLQQAIKLLQLSNVELVEFVEQEIERNPLLERDDGTPALQGEGVGGQLSETEPPPEADRPVETTDRTGTDRLTDAEGLAGGSDGPLDTDYGNVFTNGSATDSNDAPAGDQGGFAETWHGAGGNANFDDDSFGIEQNAAEAPSLRDHLIGQVNVEIAGTAERGIALEIIDHLDESGYVRMDPAAVADQLGCTESAVLDVLRRLQRLDPPGVFARDLGECLALQLAEKNRLDPAMQALLDHLPVLAQRDFTTLQRVCGVDRDDLAEMVAEIRALNPKPASAFDHHVAQTVTPDVLMWAKPDGGWHIELNGETLPKVLVNQRYAAEINAAAKSKEDREYVSECLNSANWLMKSLHQRATTILKVASEIVRQQDAFFHHGVQHLKPLILRDIADAIGMHESTVSRVTSNKFLATPRGVFELKYFFNASIQGSHGAAAHSAEAVKFRIKLLIEGEQPKNVLSDDRIVEILNGDGVDIARRTVAKYREALHIPSSVQRRREKSMTI